jgi:hypothetical protein
MRKEEVEYILEAYGLDRILEDNQMKLVDILEILNDLGYIDLEQYEDVC